MAAIVQMPFVPPLVLRPVVMLLRGVFPLKIVIGPLLKVLPQTNIPVAVPMALVVSCNSIGLILMVILMVVSLQDGSALIIPQQVPSLPITRILMIIVNAVQTLILIMHLPILSPVMMIVDSVLMIIREMHLLQEMISACVQTEVQRIAVMM